MTETGAQGRWSPRQESGLGTPTASPNLLAKAAAGLAKFLQTMESSVFQGISKGSNSAANKITEWTEAMNPMFKLLTDSASSVAALSSIPAALGSNAAMDVQQHAMNAMEAGVNWQEEGKDKFLSSVNDYRYSPEEANAEAFGLSYLAREKEERKKKSENRNQPPPKKKSRVKGYKPANRRR
jgi:hypothetical protein